MAWLLACPATKETGNECGAVDSNTTQKPDGTCACIDGHEWEDPADQDLHRCIKALPAPIEIVPTGSTGPLDFYVPDHQTVDAPFDFPADPDFKVSQIIMHYELICPGVGCDPCDRDAWVKVIQNRGTAQETAIEVWRMITPFCVGGTWNLDVTHLAPILKGAQTVRAYIGTGVGPNDAYQQDGWKLALSFRFTWSRSAVEPVAVIPLWDVLTAE